MMTLVATLLTFALVLGLITLLLREPHLLSAATALFLGVVFLSLPLYVTMAAGVGLFVFALGALAMAYGVNTISALRQEWAARRLERAMASGRIPMSAMAPVRAPAGLLGAPREQPLGYGWGTRPIERVPVRLGVEEPRTSVLSRLVQSRSTYPESGGGRERGPGWDDLSEVRSRSPGSPRSEGARLRHEPAPTELRRPKPKTTPVAAIPAIPPASTVTAAVPAPIAEVSRTRVSATSRKTAKIAAAVPVPVPSVTATPIRAAAQGEAATVSPMADRPRRPTSKPGNGGMAGGGAAGVNRRLLIEEAEPWTTPATRQAEPRSMAVRLPRGA
ncbi:membrane hypothetical protein [uncultured Gammaproteobacteria bacterium]